MVPPLIPQPLHSILLVIKTRSGPRLVLHYPPAPDASTGRHVKHTTKVADVTGNHDGFSSDEDTSSSESSQYLNRSPIYQNTSKSASFNNVSQRDPDDSGLEFGSASADSMARLLTPSSRGWNKKRFELGLENRVYLACPMFEREDGGWTKKRKVKSQREEDKEHDSDKTTGMREVNKLKGDKAGVSLSRRSTDDHSASDENDEEGLDTNEEPIHWSMDSSRRGTTTSSPSETRLSREDSSSTRAGDISPATPASHGSAVFAVPQASATHESSSVSDQTIPGSFATTGTSESIPSQASSGALQSMPQTLTMFNLVFVIEPNQDADTQRVTKVLYSNVVKQLTKALKWSQKRYAWVWSESRAVIGIREKHKDRGVSYKELWPLIHAKSGLARAVAAAFEGISKGEVAHLVLGPSRSLVHLSLQIPQSLFAESAPSPMVAPRNGYYTTTYEPLLSTVPGDEDSAKILCPHSALLLLTPASDLLADLEASGVDPSVSNPFLQYIRRSVPTKTIRQLSRNMRSSLPALQAFSQHLIQWRRAIAIPPLHTSHVYVINPNADFTRLASASDAYSLRFPTLPALTTMLIKLSGHGVLPASTSTANIHLHSFIPRSTGPQPFGAFIPSSDHKAAYMELLEWLMRDGWIVQLRTFAWVRVSPSIKATVARAMKAEKHQQILTESFENGLEMETDADVETDDNADPDAASTTLTLGGTTSDEERSTVSTPSVPAAHTPLLPHQQQHQQFARRRGHRKTSSGGSIATPAFSPRLRAILGPPTKPASDAGSSSSAKTAVRISNKLKLPQRDKRKSSSSGASQAHRLSDGSGSGSTSIRINDDKKPVITASPVNDAAAAAKTEVDADADADIQESDFEPSIVLSPHRANAVESRWLKQVGEALPTEELRNAWPKLVRHFDGKHALEEIALREGWKRKATTPLLQRLMWEGSRVGDDGLNGGNGTNNSNSNKGLGILLVVRHW